MTEIIQSEFFYDWECLIFGSAYYNRERNVIIIAYFYNSDYDFHPDFLYYFLN